jgi:hypothetical protein
MSTVQLIVYRDFMNNYRLSGSAYNSPESAAYRATYSLDVTGPYQPTGTVKYYYTKTRMNFVSTGITAMSKNGDTFSISGTGTVNGMAGYAFVTSFTSGAPDSFSMEIRKPDKSLYFTAAVKPAAGGDIAVTQK